MINISVWQETVQDLCDALTLVSSIDEVIEAGVGARSVELAGGTIDRTILDAQLQLRLDATTSADEAAELIGLGAAIPPPEVVGGSYIGEVDIFPVVNPFVTFDTPDGGTWLPSGNVIPVAQAPELAAYQQFKSVSVGTAVYSGDPLLYAHYEKRFYHNGLSAGILYLETYGAAQTNAPRFWVTLDNGATFAARTFTTPGFGNIRFLGIRWEGTGFRIFVRVQNSGVYQSFLTLADLAGAGPYSLTSITALAAEQYSYYGAGVIWDGTKYIFNGVSSNGTGINISTSADGVTFSTVATRGVGGGGLSSNNSPSNGFTQVLFTDRIVVITAWGTSQAVYTTTSTDGGVTYSNASAVPSIAGSNATIFGDCFYESGKLVTMTVENSSIRRFKTYTSNLGSTEAPNRIAGATPTYASSRVSRVAEGHYVFTASGIYSDNSSRIYVHETVDAGVTWSMTPLILPGDTQYQFFAALPSGGYMVISGSTIYKLDDLNATHVGIAEPSVVGFTSGTVRTYHCLRIN